MFNLIDNALRHARRRPVTLCGIVDGDAYFGVDDTAPVYPRGARKGVRASAVRWAPWATARDWASHRQEGADMHGAR